MCIPCCEAVVMPFIQDLLAKLDPNQLEAFNERAGMIAFDAGQPKALAESLAMIDTLKRWPELLTSMGILRFEHQGRLQWWLTTDLLLARRTLHAAGIHAHQVLSLHDGLQTPFTGVAQLVPLSAL